MFSLASLALILTLVCAGGALAVARVDALDYRTAIVAVAVALAVGGVVAQVTPADSTATIASDRAPKGETTTATPTSAADERAVASAGPVTAVADANGSRTNATVVEISAADRLTYRTASGERRTVSLAGVDAPGPRGAAPERFDGVLTGSRGRTCLAEQGRRTLVDARSLLVGESVTVQSVERERGDASAVLTADGRSVNRRLIERGDARATDGRYADAERAARSAGRGVWSCATVEPSRPLRASDETGLRIAAVHPNPPGDDTDALTDEYVVIENVGERTVDLSDWYLVAGDEAYFFFDARTLRPGETLVVHVGSGRDTDDHVYWGASAPVLDNDHETLKLVDGDSGWTVRLSY
jgi:micrococcal nuclease